MKKLQFLVHCPEDEGCDSFCGRVMRDLAPALLARDPAGLKVCLTEPGLPRPWHLPVRRTGLALISIWLDDDEDPDGWTETVRELGCALQGFRVTESAPRSYARDWADGERTPGAALLTLFRKNPRVTRRELLSRWHERHSPMALRIHPLWAYLRNVVEESLDGEAPGLDGIVEEHFRSDRDLTDPRRFYGTTLAIVPRLAHIVAQTSTFLDLFTLENYIVAEYHLRTPR